MSCGLFPLNNLARMGVLTPSTLIPIGIGVASPRFSKSNRKLKKTKHCTIPNLRKTKAKEFKNKGTGLNKVNMEIEIP